MNSSAGRGLLFDAADLPRIRANLELPRFREVRNEVFPADLAAEERFLRDEINLKDRVTDMLRAWKLVMNAAFAFALTQDARQLALARLGLKRLAQYKEWDYFLEGGNKVIGLQRAPETTIACILALDWLGDALPADERAAVEEQIILKGAPACFNTLYGMKYPDRVRGWTQNPEENFGFKIDMARWPLILNSTNLKVIPICGLGLAAVWFAGRHASTPVWLDLARTSARAFAMMYGTDGSYDEGVSYWSYTTMHLILFAEALYRRTGVDDRSLINYRGTVRYALSLTMPTRGEPYNNLAEKKAYNATPKGLIYPEQSVVNFGDALGADFSIAPWVAQVHRDPVAQHVTLNAGGLKHLPSAIWFQPDAPAQAPGAELLNVHLSNDLVISRTGWTPDDAVVALRSGGPGNHEHADRNSVLFAAYGERFFHDPYKAAYIASVPRWRLRLTAAHTAVLVNGQGHQYHDGHEGTNASWAWAHVVAYRAEADALVVSSEATEAYQLVQPGVQGVRRTLVFLKPDVLVIFDEVWTATPVPVQVRFQIYNEDGHGAGAVQGSAFTVTRPRAHLAVVAQAAGAYTVKAGRIELPPEEGEFPLVEVESAAATDHAIVTACVAQRQGAPAGRLAIGREGPLWTVRGTHNGRKIDVTLIPVAAGAPTVKIAH
ncbi:MAG: heparinase II/III family protein [Opitutales bacterium]